MRRMTVLVAAVVLSTASVLMAGPEMTVTLKDKSTLRGELIEFKDGVYRLNTSSLGEVKIPADKVLVIKAGDENSQETEQSGKQKPRTPAIREGVPQSKAPAAEKATPGPASDNLQEQQKAVNSQVQSMLMDGSFMDNITNLGQNETMQDILQDPQVMEAIRTGDYNFLMNNEKMKKLIESPDLQGILGGMSPEGAGE